MFFIGDNGGVRVFRNTSSGNTLSFVKAHHQDKLQLSTSSGNINLYVSKTDIPGITDIDNDGDLDILTFSGSYLQLFENKQSCGLDYEAHITCWGDFVESGSSNSAILDSCAIKKKHFKTMHVGGTVLPIDLDGDGIKDLLIGDTSFDNILALYNDGALTDPHIYNQETDFPQYDQPIDMTTFPACFYEDVTGDGIEDLMISPNQRRPRDGKNYRSIQLYKNTGSGSSPHFQWVKNNFLQDEQIDLGEGCVPRLVDLNGDSLQDLILANYSYYHPLGIPQPTFTYFQNIGNKHNPIFNLTDTNFVDIGSYNFGLMPIPTFGDLDNDGDYDMLVGDENGRVHYFTNNGSATFPSFSLTTSPVSNIDVDFSAAPFLFDMDSNGTLDLLVGSERGIIHYYKNNSNINPDFILEDNLFGGVDVSDINLDGFSVPYVFEHSGKLNLMVGSVNGVYQFDSVSEVISQGTLRTGIIGNGNILSNGHNETPAGTSKIVGRNQYLILASELQAKGLRSGYINSLSFEGASGGHNLIQKGIDIYMKNTSISSLNGFENNLIPVTIGKRVQFGNGWVPIPFLEDSFFWDGTSNLLIQVCFSNNNFVQNDPIIKMSNTSFISNTWGDVIPNNGIGINGCSIPYLASSHNRPNMKLIISSAFVNTDIFLRDGSRNAAAFGDLDNDGFIDAFLGNFSGGITYHKGKIYDIGLNEIQNPKQRLEVYPNPGHHLFMINTKNIGLNAQLRIYDQVGRLVVKRQISDDLTTVDLSNQQSGLYLFILQDKQMILSQKVIKH